MKRARSTLVLLGFLAACSSATSGAGTGPVPVASPVSPAELSRDLFVFASDSFGGRETGTPYAMKAARFLADRLMTLGLEPAGDSLYYQRVPLIKDSFGPATRNS